MKKYFMKSTTMKNIRMLAATITCVGLMSTSAFALAINDPGVVGTIEPDGGQGSSEAIETQWANTLLGLPQSAFPVRTDGDTVNSDPDLKEDYQTNPDIDYSGVLSLWVRMVGTTGDISGFEYVLGKYDGQNAGYVLFNVTDYLLDVGGTTLAQTSETIWVNTSSEGFQLSHITGFGTRDVPEPTTMLLLGIGLVGVFVARKKLA